MYSACPEAGTISSPDWPILPHFIEEAFEKIGTLVESVQLKAELLKVAATVAKSLLEDSQDSKPPTPQSSDILNGVTSPSLKFRRGLTIAIGATVINYTPVITTS